MFIIREVFTAKPGQAGKLAKLFKKMPMKAMKTQVMTDTVGPYNTVVMEMEVESLAAWEEEMEKHRRGDPDPEMDKLDAETKEAMAKYHEMYTHGRREIFRITE
jgi:hypothetical protein